MSAHTFVDACTDEHFRQMSLLHALGWRTTYQEAVPADYMAEVVTDERWVSYFRADYETGRRQGLLLYSDGFPVACATFGPARVDDATGGGSLIRFESTDYVGWGEVVSFYVHPDEKRKGYGRLLMEEVLRRLAGDGFARCLVLVLRENETARRFYAAHGFSWDGTQVEIPFPNGVICTDLRYTRTLSP